MKFLANQLFHLDAEFEANIFQTPKINNENLKTNKMNFQISL